MKTRFFTLALALLLVAACGQGPDTTSAKDGAADADNTARNDRDKNDAAMTPMDQGQSEPDVQMTANIRKAIVDDDSLSMNAHNIKIITNGGNVVLRGPVKNQQEKAAVEAKAAQIAGAARVRSFLEIEAHP